MYLEERIQLLEQRISLLESKLGRTIPVNGNHVEANEVLTKVCEWYSVTPGELASTRRPSHLVWPRHLAIFLIVQFCQNECPSSVARLMGHDPSSVYHALRRIRSVNVSEPKRKPEVDRAMQYFQKAKA